jgi:hypothetical protein
MTGRLFFFKRAKIKQVNAEEQARGSSTFENSGAFVFGKAVAKEVRTTNGDFARDWHRDRGIVRKR